MVAVYPYRQASADELSFNAGDDIIVINEGQEEGWYYGICNQRTGLLPANYVTLAPDENMG
ncbi:putative paraflagellar rod protein [Diplonema papillatum]|nr:putative paraflagellar rod protein [Diplonema papillatum]